jgi:S-adenosylmethionine hydrolase
MREPSNVIALVTDFGLKDHYVGVMKGVILSVNPHANIVDVSHEIPSQGILDAYFLLSNTYAYFPKKTVFVTVVDPGVGTDRAILAVQTDAYLFLAPDNGILGFLGKAGKVRRIVRVREQKYFLKPLSNTFHGRDIFAPVAAHLSLGLDPRKLGPETDRMETLSAPSPRVTREGVIVGEVVSIDRFGNLLTNIPGDRLSSADSVEVRLGKTVVRGLCESYATGRKGQLIALVGSSGTVEVSVNRGSAQKRTRSRVGDVVRVRHSQK